jgi:hypothetical protein
LTLSACAPFRATKAAATAIKLARKKVIIV